jgi:hypothetical protein
MLRRFLGSRAPISRVSTRHLYDDDDMGYANEARNERDGFYHWAIPGREPSNILVRDVADPSRPGGKRMEFVTDGKCGMTIEMPNGYTVDPRGGFSYEFVLADLLRMQMPYIAHLASAGIPYFPIKILFPYRYGALHWNAGEVIVDPVKGLITATAYDPYGVVSDLPPEIGRLVKAAFGMLDTTRVAKALCRIPKVQFGGVFCGGYSGRAVHNLKTKTSANIWDGVSERGGLKSDIELRLEDFDLVQLRGSSEAKAKFLVERGDALGALHSDASPAASSAASKVIDKRPSTAILKEFRSRLSEDDLQKLAELLDELKAYGALTEEYGEDLRGFLKMIGNTLDAKEDGDGVKLATLSSHLLSHSEIAQIFVSKGGINNVAIYEEIVSHFATLDLEEARAKLEKEEAKKGKMTSSFGFFHEITYSKKEPNSTAKTFFQCDLYPGDKSHNFSRPSDIPKPKVNISHEYGEAVSDSLQAATKGLGFSAEEIAVIILVAIGKNGFTGKSDVELINKFGEIYKSDNIAIKGTLPSREINSDFIATVRLFSKAFQDAMKEKNFLTGNEEARNPEVGTRLKRLTPIHARFYCQNEKLVGAVWDSHCRDTPSSSPGAASTVIAGARISH